MKSESFTSNNTRQNFDVDIFGFNEWFIKEFKMPSDIQIDTISPTIQVDWTFYWEMRSWGVKSIGAYATKVSGSILVEYYDNQDQQHEFEIDDLVLNEYFSKWEKENQDCILSNDQRQIKDTFMVDTCTIDFEEKNIEVQF